MAVKKKTNKKTERKRSKKITELSQAHGKEEKFQPQTLDQIWGDEGNSKYKTLDVDVYKAQLADMSISDLQTHATQVGLIPIDNLEQLRKRLVSEFQKHVSMYKVPKINTRNKPVSKEAMDILSEGK